MYYCLFDQMQLAVSLNKHTDINFPYCSVLDLYLPRSRGSAHRREQPLSSEEGQHFSPSEQALSEEQRLGFRGQTLSEISTEGQVDFASRKKSWNASEIRQNRLLC